jgi:Flp pilus assembly protein TadD
MRIILLPVLMLTSVVLALMACPRAPESLQQAEPAPKARVDMGEPPIVDAGPTQVASRAMSAFEAEALAAGFDDDRDHEQLGDALQANNDTEAAIASYRTALSQGQTASRWQKLGDAYLKSGERDRGRRALIEALSLDSDSVATLTSLTRLSLDEQDKAEARTMAETLVARAPDNTAARRLLARAYLQNSMWKEAITQFEHVVRDNPDDVFAHNNLGFAALQIGSLSLARDHLERCLSLEPQRGYMMNNLGVAYERLGRRAEAHAAFSRAAELDPKYGSARFNRERLAQRLTDDERIESAETLLALRTPAGDGATAPAALTADDAGGDGALEGIADEAGSGELDATAGGGSARLAPHP